MIVTKRRQAGRRQLNIKTLAHLSGRLGIPVAVLVGVADSIVFQYNRIALPKKDGSARRIDAPSERLKQVQRSINENLLASLWLPLAATLDPRVPSKPIGGHRDRTPPGQALLLGRPTFRTSIPASRLGGSTTCSSPSGVPRMSPGC
jgi:hypothetical protein